MITVSLRHSFEQLFHALNRLMTQTRDDCEQGVEVLELFADQRHSDQLLHALHALRHRLRVEEHAIDGPEELLIGLLLEGLEFALSLVVGAGGGCRVGVVAGRQVVYELLAFDATEELEVAFEKLSRDLTRVQSQQRVDRKSVV